MPADRITPIGRLNAAHPVVRAWRLAFAALAVAAIMDTLTTGLGQTSFSVANFLSYFTIESNVVGIVVLVVDALCVPQSRGFDAVRGAATFYLVVTGIVYAALLSNVGVGIAAEWTDTVLHRVMPIVILLDWLLVLPLRAVRSRAALAWLIYPLAYFAYSLIRGPIVDWYPYPFLNPGHPGGYGRVALYAIVLAVVLALLAIGIAWLGTALSRARGTGRSPPHRPPVR